MLRDQTCSRGWGQVNGLSTGEQNRSKELKSWSGDKVNSHLLEERGAGLGNYDQQDVGYVKQEPTHMNNVGPTPTLVPTMAQPHHYATLGAIPHIYEQPQPTKELNKYASLKAVAEKANDNFYVNRRHLTELTTKGSLPLHPVRLEPQPGPAYGTMLPVPKQNGHKPRVARSQGPQPLPYASHTIASTAMLRGWNGSEMVGHRTLYGAPRKHGTMDRFGELHVSRSQHYLSPQPYFVTNSKTEVTV
ncbi:hypothetical protein Z043_102664 [Scleropages formosus]|uniref:Protein shisa-9B-like n=1 Tax=Scleropages formosus TaxID=113540 RepID=A0A0P7VUR6_SCLFO|nr:hypothetical protein Z043_102664 [Scleropages formosus]